MTLEALGALLLCEKNLRGATISDLRESQVASAGTHAPHPRSIAVKRARIIAHVFVCIRRD
jgi:hypothetical protein